MKIKVLNIVGARPNFMKIAPIISEMKKHPDLELKLLHTGQHYDAEVQVLFRRFADSGTGYISWRGLRESWGTDRQDHDRI